jgi:hypothetical protein
MQPFREPHKRERVEGWHMRGRGEESSSNAVFMFLLVRKVLLY